MTSFDKDSIDTLAKCFYKGVSSWARKHLRSFPWRFSGDPYRVFISEILLRRTTSTAVKRVYSNFIALYPDIIPLSESLTLEDDLLSLGLNKQRSKQLIEAAKCIVKEFGGRIPETVIELTKIPGIGHYGANAILCFGFGQNVPILDSNVRRIVKRFLGELSPTDREREEFLRVVLEDKDGVWFNYGLLDMGATICKPVNPDCDLCPLAFHCRWPQISNH